MSSPASVFASAPKLQFSDPQQIALQQSELQQRQQQAQEAALKIQQTRQQLGEYQSIRAATAANGGDLSAGLEAANAAGQVSPESYLAMKNTMATTAKSRADADKAAADAQTAAQALQTAQQAYKQRSLEHVATWAYANKDAPLAAVLGSIDHEEANAPDDPQIKQELEGLRQTLTQNPDQQAAVMQHLQTLAPEAVAKLQASDNANAEAPLTRAKTEADTGKLKADTAATQTETQIKQMKLDAAKHPELFDQAIDAVAGGDTVQAMAAKNEARFYLQQGDTDKASAVIDKLATRKGATAEDVAKAAALIPTKVAEANALIPTEAKKAQAVEQAEVAIKVGQAAAEEAARNNITGASLDREAKQYGAVHQKAMADADSQLEKIADARAMINGSAEAQALGIPKVLTALVAGQGSGVRITQPELNAIGTARGIGGDVQGFVNSMSGQGKLTNTQQAQLTGILDAVKDRIQQKRQIASDALDTINGAKDRGTIIATDQAARQKLGALSQGAGVAAPAVPKALLQAGPGIHKLSDGTTWKKDRDGTITKVQ